MSHKLFALLALSLALAASAAGANARAQQQHTHAGNQSKSADHSKHDAHAAEVKERGERAMGFSQEKTTHRFRLLWDGGAIEVGVHDAEDVENREHIRGHLRDIAQKFAAGDFAKPKEVHAQTPPGIETMRRLRDEISFRYEEMERGGRVRISTRSAEALDAVHTFLRFQIEDHSTGDAVEVEPRP